MQPTCGTIPSMTLSTVGDDHIMKILVVDDEKTNCDIVNGFLLNLGVNNIEKVLEYAYDGEQAIIIV
jgi:CheY-like chemotaxis protein